MTEKTDLPALIAEVRRLDAEATPGPWVAEPDGGPHRGRVEERSPRGIETIAYTYCGAYDGHGARNAELVAYFRTAAPLLASECSRLQERVRVLEAALRPFADRAADYDRPVDDPGYPIEPDYRPKEQRTRRLLIGDLRAARAALEGIEVE